MEKIRIAHLVNDLGFAGKEKGIMKIASRMDPARFDVDIVVLKKVHRDALTKADHFNTIELGKKPGNDLKLFYQLAHIFKKNRYDIIYTHSWNTLVEGYAGARLANVPARIHGEHGTFEHSFLKDKLQNIIWRRFDVVTVVADVLQQKMQAEFNYKRANVRVIHNGIDGQKFFPSQAYRGQFRKKHQLNGHFVVGTVGRFHPVKDHFTLFRGFAKLKAQLGNAKLLLVGRETYAKISDKYNRLIANLGIKKDVLFLPPTSNVEQIINGLDAFVLSSISEGCSNVVLEAMACGIPVIATNTGGNPELIQDGETGLLFNVRDVDGLVKRLITLYSNNDLRQKLQKAGPAVVQKGFSLDQTVANYENLYMQLVREKRKSHNGRFIDR